MIKSILSPEITFEFFFGTNKCDTVGFKLFRIIIRERWLIRSCTATIITVAVRTRHDFLLYIGIGLHWWFMNCFPLSIGISIHRWFMRIWRWFIGRILHFIVRCSINCDAACKLLFYVLRACFHWLPDRWDTNNHHQNTASWAIYKKMRFSWTTPIPEIIFNLMGLENYLPKWLYSKMFTWKLCTLYKIQTRHSVECLFGKWLVGPVIKKTNIL